MSANEGLELKIWGKKSQEDKMDEGPGFLELALTYTQFRACDTAEQSMRGNLLQNMPEKAM